MLDQGRMVQLGLTEEVRTEQILEGGEGTDVQQFAGRRAGTKAVPVMFEVRRPA